jgi:hypothetical protein
MTTAPFVLGRCTAREPNGRMCRRTTDPTWILCEHHHQQLLQACQPNGTAYAEALAGEIAYLRLAMRVIAVAGGDSRLAPTLAALSRTLTTQQSLGAATGNLETLLAAMTADIVETSRAKQEEP